MKTITGITEMNIIKQVAGIDVSKDTLEVGYGTVDTNQNQEITKPIKVQNNPSGFKELLAFVKKAKGKTDAPLYFVMEATGVYYENLAYFLEEKHLKVIVLLPNKTKNYAKTLDVKSKTDKLDAKMITQFGLERQMETWKVPSPTMKALKALTREHSTIKRMITILKNQIHSKEYAHKPLKESIKRNEAAIVVFEKQLKEIEKQIKSITDNDNDLNDKIKKIEKVEGLGFMTIVSVIAETNGFALIENAKQLASFAGLDVVYNESGIKKKKTSISKKGNKHLRKALYMPALSACRWNPLMKKLFVRLSIRNTVKQVGIIAVARKLLLLIYTLYKNNSEYIPNYKICKA